MPGAESVDLVVAEWVAKAENDLNTAAHTLKLGRVCPTGTVCFHAQQCAEKYLKAYLVSRAVPFPKTPEIEGLVSLMPDEARPSLSVEEQSLLTEYAVGSRYPGWMEGHSAHCSPARRDTCPACAEAYSLTATEWHSAPEESLMEPWYKATEARKEVREGRSFKPDEFAIRGADLVFSCIGPALELLLCERIPAFMALP
jgi:HEPN domain-containing protein